VAAELKLASSVASHLRDATFKRRVTPLGSPTSWSIRWAMNGSLAIQLAGYDPVLQIHRLDQHGIIIFHEVRQVFPPGFMLDARGSP
jgi:hypothetical protein